MTRNGIEPPPFKPLIIRLPDSDGINFVDVLDADENPIKSLRGDERAVLSELKCLLDEENPDVIVIDDTRP